MTLPPVVRSRKWQGAAAAFTIAGLLLAFHQVVAHAVRQGELLRMDAANHAQAVWRCNAMRDIDLRDACLDQLNSPPRQEAGAPSASHEPSIEARVAQWTTDERRR